MPKYYSLTFRQRMIDRLTGSQAVSAGRLAREVGVSQDTLSRWLREGPTLPAMGRGKQGGGAKRPQGPFGQKLTVDDKVRILADSKRLSGEELAVYLREQKVALSELEAWRRALEEDTPARAAVASKQVRDLERELARKEKALAEAAALLVLKKKLQHLLEPDADDDEDPGSAR